MYYKIIKSFLDIILALLLIPLLLIILIPISVLIKIEDGGPIFYLSERLGKDKVLFKMFKFRTMKVDSPDIRLEDGSTFNSSDDIRVTKIGKKLRESSLDEIPQILNVLIGDMSLVGPRPDIPGYADQLLGGDRVVLSVRPGITGPASLKYQYEESI